MHVFGIADDRGAMQSPTRWKISSARKQRRVPVGSIRWTKPISRASMPSSSPSTMMTGLAGKIGKRGGHCSCRGIAHVENANQHLSCQSRLQDGEHPHRSGKPAADRTFRIETAACRWTDEKPLPIG